METVNGSAGAGAMRAFITNHGPHAPEVVADMTMHQIVDRESNPYKAAEVRQALVDLYAQAIRTARVIFKHADNDTMKRAINQIVVRDFATALDIERQFSKE